MSKGLEEIFASEMARVEAAMTDLNSAIHQDATEDAFYEAASAASDLTDQAEDLCNDIRNRRLKEFR